MSLFGRGSMMMARQNAAATANPLDILGLKLEAWWDADDVASFPGLSGTSIGVSAPPAGGWLDRSGNAHHLTKASGITRETAVINGRAVVRFDGVNGHVFTTTSFLYALATAEIWIVAKSDESGTGTLVSEGNTTSGAQVYRLYDDDTNNDYVFQYTNTSNVDRFINTQNRSTNDWDLVIATDRGTATGTSVEVVDVDAGTTGAYTRDGGTWTRFALGATFRSTVTLYFDGDIAEVAVLDSAASAGERTDLATYFNTKYGKSWTPA